MEERVSRSLAALPPPTIYRSEARAGQTRADPSPESGSAAIENAASDSPSAATASGDIAAEEDGGAADEDGPRWPDDVSEASFLAEQPPRLAEISVPLAPRDGATAGSVNRAVEAEMPLPPLQSLIDRIPTDARETLDELFRARFVSVKRVQPQTLKGEEDAN